MNFENESKFNQQEQPETSSAETEKRLMSPEEVGEQIESLNEFVKNFKVSLVEEQDELQRLQERPNADAVEIEALKSEIQDRQKELLELEDYAAELIEALSGGEQIFDRKVE